VAVYTQSLRIGKQDEDTNVEPIDVVMLTKDSERLLHRCVESIYKNVPVKRLIIVDAFSKDSTLQILKNFNDKHNNVEIITENGSRARARQAGIRHVRTPWFLFVDSDVILCKDWARKAERQIRTDVGAIWGLNIDVIPNMTDRLAIRALAIIAEECFKLRGGTHDTLIRRELVEDIKIPERLHAYEDAYIVNWIKKKGFRVISGDKIYCLHYGPYEDATLKQGLSSAKLEITCGLVYSHSFKNFLYYPFLIFYWMLRFQNRIFNPS